MMVVMVVSRRVGQVTLAVSERTSCRNLNGLKAILLKSTSVTGRFAKASGNPNSRPLGPSPRLKVELVNELDCSGNLKPRRISAIQAGRLRVAAIYCGTGQRSRSV